MSDRKHVAYHEAGHVAADMVLGHVSLGATIAPKGAMLGSAGQLYGDDLTPEGMRDLIIALYAGAEAEKRICADHDQVRCGASSDDEKAEEYLPLSDSTESVLRKAAAQLVEQHWEFVEMIAAELMKFQTLIYDEIAIVYDIYQGESTFDDLARFRLLFADEINKQRRHRT